jgi:formylglycine-generating enzyme required for sulfatase activity
MDTTHFPVERVNWNDAAEFCSKLSLRENLKPFYFRASETVTPLEGNGYRLPTEAEWEFACAAGTTSKLRIGELDDDVIRVAWTNINSGGRTHAVGELKANPFGLFDIAGNVWEWVQDTWEPTYYEQLAGTALAVNPCNSASRNSRRVIRGGGFTYGPFNCRFSHRFSNERWERHGNCGFRIALTIDAVKKMESERNADTN